MGRRYLSDNELMEKIWDNSEKLSFPDFDDKNGLVATWAKVEARKHTRKMMFTVARIAAVLVIGLVLTFAVTGILTRSNDNQFVEIIVNRGERLTINLPDGNKVWLNSNSKIKYPANFTGMNRRLEISGEAYFEIKNKSFFPLMVSAQNTLINCDSASFNIKCSENQAYVIVEKGWVSLSNTLIPEPYILNGGELATLTNNLNMPLVVESSKSKNLLAWKTGNLVFEEAPLGVVAQALSDCYGVSVKIEGDLKYCDFTSTYSKADMSEIIADIQQVYSSQIIKTADGITIMGNKKCN